MLNQNSSPWKTISSTLRPSEFGSSVNNTPEKKQQQQLYSGNGSPLPNTFKFTPTKGRKLYPNLNPPDKRLLPLNINSSPSYGSHNIDSELDESYMIKDNTSFLSAMDNLGNQLFSSNISNKVMNEFSSRYDKAREESIQTVQELNNSTTNEQLNRRASGRYSNTHRNRFNRMESIAFHYAAKRSKNLDSNPNNVQNLSSNSATPVQRKLVSPKESLTFSDNTVLMPNDKRFFEKPLESASKRIRLNEKNYKEIDSSPTKTLYEKEQLKNTYSNLQMNFDDTEKYDEIISNSNIPSYLQPTKAFLRKSSSNKQLSPSKSSKSLAGVLKTTILQPDNGNIGGLSRSPSISPTRSISHSKNSSSMSKISPSRAFSNLNKILNTPPPSSVSQEVHSAKENLSKFPSSSSNNKSMKTHIPRSTTLGPINNNSQKSIPRSKTSNLSYNKSHISSASVNDIRSLSGSSSIPRLAKLANVESRIKNTSKYNENDNNGKKPLKPWR